MNEIVECGICKLHIDYKRYVVRITDKEHQLPELEFFICRSCYISMLK